MAKPTYIGIDQSYKETVVTVLTSPNDYTSYSFKGKGETTLEKLQSIYLEVFKLFIVTPPMNIRSFFVEGGSYGSTGRLFSLGQLSGALLTFAIIGKAPYKEISPSGLKKFVTGRGHCSKQHVMDKIRERFGQDFDNDNYADSYGLAVMAYYHDNYDKMPNKNRPSKETVHSLSKTTKKTPKLRYRRSKTEF